MERLIKTIYRSLLACALIIEPTSANAQGASNFMIGTDMMKPDVYLINTESDKRVKLDLTKDPKWPGGLPLHTIITADGSKGLSERHELR